MIVQFKYNGDGRCCGSFGIDDCPSRIYVTPINHGLSVLLSITNMDFSVINEHCISYGEDYHFNLINMSKTVSKSKITIHAQLSDIAEEPEGTVALRGTYVTLVITEEKI